MKPPLSPAQLDWLLSADTAASRLDRFLEAPVVRPNRPSRSDGAAVLAALEAATASGTPAVAALAHLADTLPVKQAALASTMAEQLRCGASVAQAVASAPEVYGERTGPLISAHTSVSDLPAALRQVMIAGPAQAPASGRARAAAAVATLSAALASVLLPAVPSAQHPVVWAAATAALLSLCAAAWDTARAHGRLPSRLARRARAATAGTEDAALTLSLLATLLSSGQSVRTALDTVSRTASGQHGRALEAAAAAAWDGSDLATALAVTPELSAAAVSVHGVTDRSELAARLREAAAVPGREPRRAVTWYDAPAATAAAAALAACWVAAH